MADNRHPTLGRSLTADVMRSVKDVNLAVGLRSIIWDVGQMARDSVSIAEVGINRKLETPSDFCPVGKSLGISFTFTSTDSS
jgi:hypothetical protein